jgi:flagellar assembly factor FliW
MDIQTSRFGRVQFDPEDVIDFPEGILGFGHVKKYILVEDPFDEVFIWLQSCDGSDIAFPILEPQLFSATYKVDLNKHDLESLKLSSMDGSRVFSIVTIPENISMMTANLKAPIIINVSQRMARQCVLQDNDLPIREPIFKALQSRVYPAASDAAPVTRQKCEVFVRLPEVTE